MTGFGRSELKSRTGFIRVELKSVNHKFLEVSPRLPMHLGEYEDQVRRVVSQGVRRGKVQVFIAAPDPAAFSSKLVLNEPLAREVMAKVRRLKSVLGLKHVGEGPVGEEILLREVLRYPDVLSKDLSAVGRSGFTAELERTIRAAMKNFDGSRAREGAALGKDILARVSEVERSLGLIRKRIPALGKEYKRSLEARMKEFLKEGGLDRERLALEVAQYVKNSDISEEVVRMASHIDAVRRAVKETGELGRKLDFIGQEMTREANTMGSKSNDSVIANAVIAIKSAIEKIREQAQNVE